MNAFLAIGLFFFVSIGIFLLLVFRGSSGSKQPPTPPPVVCSPPPPTVEDSIDTLENYCGITEADRRARIASRISRIGGTFQTATDVQNSTVDPTTATIKRTAKS